MPCIDFWFYHHSCRNMERYLFDSHKFHFFVVQPFILFFSSIHFIQIFFGFLLSQCYWIREGFRCVLGVKNKRASASLGRRVLRFWGDALSPKKKSDNSFYEYLKSFTAEKQSSLKFQEFMLRRHLWEISLTKDRSNTKSSFGTQKGCETNKKNFTREIRFPFHIERNVLPAQTMSPSLRIVQLESLTIVAQSQLAASNSPIYAKSISIKLKISQFWLRRSLVGGSQNSHQPSNKAFCNRATKTQRWFVGWKEIYKNFMPMAVKRILEFNMQIFGVRLIYGGEEQFRIPLEQTICTEINLLPLQLMPRTPQKLWKLILSVHWEFILPYTLTLPPNTCHFELLRFWKIGDIWLQL